MNRDAPFSDGLADEDRFLTRVSQIHTGITQAVAVGGQYHPSAYHANLFSTLGIGWPANGIDTALKRQLEYLAGRCLARSALEILGAAPADLPTGEGGVPVWPAGIAGSISHSKGTAVCLVVPDPAALVGIDVERIAKDRPLRAIMRKGMNEAERALIQTAPPVLLPTLATLVFSAKETLYKMLFPVVRRYFGFACAEVRALPDAGALRLYLTCDLHPSLPRDMFFDLRYSARQDQVLTWGVSPRP